MYPPGTILGDRYRILRLLGEGAMGAVYEAEHAVLLRRVAVKALHPRFAVVDKAVGRFVREAQAAASIGHPNIVDVMDFGAYDAVPFLVMELLRGETLAERMARDALDLETACSVATQVLSALASAHAVGIVHRDLKPENVMLLGDDRTVRVKLLDFGVSKFLQGRPDTDLRATGDGVLLGTPCYMSPEQWVGAPDIDHRADLYAVGVMLFEMLSGELPFEAPTQVEMYRLVALGTEQAPQLNALNPAVPSEVSAAVARALARTPGERFESAAAFFDALAPYARELPDLDRAPPRSRPLSLEPTPTESLFVKRDTLPPSTPPRHSAPVAATLAAPLDADPQRPTTPRRILPLLSMVAVLMLGGGFFALGRASNMPPEASTPAPPATAPFVRPARVAADSAARPTPTAAQAAVVAAPAPVLPEPVALSPRMSPPVAPRRRVQRASRPPRGGELLREF